MSLSRRQGKPMLEYVFFNETFRAQFADYLQDAGVAWTLKTDPIEETLILCIDEPEDDELWDRIDAHYDALNARDQAQTEAESNDLSGAGIYIELANGERTLATIDPDIMNRILSVISMDEFNQFVETIVSSVERPDDSPICKQLEKKAT
ncbi:MAG TPA: hypothetical protein ENK26_09515 [Gammaproteobacteria bacterium]|nr:hypothetical protein [Gammaproteobacteria bacterium]